MMMTVTIERLGNAARTLRVRVTEEQIDERADERRWNCQLPRERADLAADIARERATVRVWGRRAVWRNSGQGVDHRGQVWVPCRTGGENAATGVITMRVSS